MNDKIQRILSLRAKGWSPSRIAINVNLPIDVVRWVLSENIQEVKVESGNIRVLMDSPNGVREMLLQDDFKENPDGSFEISVDLAGLKRVIHNFQVLNIRNVRLVW